MEKNKVGNKDVKRIIIGNRSNRFGNICIDYIIIAIGMHYHTWNFSRHKPWIQWACLVGICNIVLFNNNGNTWIVGLILILDLI